MSEYGSFTTEYIFCPECFKAARTILLARRKHLCSEVIQSWRVDQELPIIAGKIGGMHPGEEILDFESGFIPELEEVICHPLRIAVLAEAGESILIALPKAENFEYLKKKYPKKVPHEQWLKRKLRITKDQLEAASTRILRLESKLVYREPNEPYYIDKIVELEGVIRDLLKQIADLKQLDYEGDSYMPYASMMQIQKVELAAFIHAITVPDYVTNSVDGINPVKAIKTGMALARRIIESRTPCKLREGQK